MKTHLVQVLLTLLRSGSPFGRDGSRLLLLSPFHRLPFGFLFSLYSTLFFLLRLILGSLLGSLRGFTLSLYCLSLFGSLYGKHENRIAIGATIGLASIINWRRKDAAAGGTCVSDCEPAQHFLL
jgi:hypothetical protein